eukprot:COSAG01_NODE_58608_length_305_cov_0.689320_2_plen_30_part_01
MFSAMVGPGCVAPQQMMISSTGIVLATAIF